MPELFTTAAPHPDMDAVVLLGPGRRYRVSRAALELRRTNGTAVLRVAGNDLAPCSDALCAQLLALGVREVVRKPPAPRRPGVKWDTRQEFFLDRKDNPPRRVYGDTLAGTYGIPKLWRDDVGEWSLKVPLREVNLTHLGTGLCITKRLVRITDMKRLGEQLLHEVPDVPPTGMPSGEVQARMKLVVDDYLETVDDEHKYEILDPAARTFESESLREVLELALASPRLPVVPPCPRIHHYDVVKRGDDQRKWKVRCDSIEMYHMTTKWDAEAAVERCRAANRKALEDWEREYRVFTMTHSEGVDFYWGT